MADWYIDSWSLLDGIAFASVRAPWDARNHRLLPPETTVMIAPPDWRAVSISRPSTAVGATRRGFQEGFFDDAGEVAFPSLSVIRAVVRRVYAAGGIGIDDAGEASFVELSGGDLPDDGTWRKIRDRLLHDPEPTARVTAREMLRDLVWSNAPHYWRALEAFTRRAADTVGPAWAHAYGPEAFRSRQDLIALHRLRADLGFSVSEPFSYDPRLWRVSPDVRERLRLLMRIPMRSSCLGYPQLRTVADRLFLLTASRQCFESLRSMGDVLPLLAAGLVVMGAAGSAPAGPGAGHDHQQWLLSRAANWVADVVPERLADADGRELKDLEQLVEETIRNVADWRMRGGTSTTKPPTGRGGPGGGVAREEPWADYSQNSSASRSRRADFMEG